MDDWQNELLNPTSIVGTLALLAVILIWWRRDAANPAQAASYNVIASSVEYAGDAFRLAQDAMREAREANQRALAAEKANIRCAHTISAFATYSRALTAQLAHEGVTPHAPPPELMDWVTDPSESG